MMPAADDLHERSRNVFLQARRLPDAARGQFVAAACAGDETLHSEVTSLLQADAQATGVDCTGSADTMRAGCDPPVIADTATKAWGDHLQATLQGWLAQPQPERLGGYRILDVIGAGGMGIVYRAEQDDPRRQVALKVMRQGISSPAVLERFRRESRILALMHHPGIAQIYQAGVADSGHSPQPYFAMELVEGQPLSEHVRTHELSRRDRLALFVEICDAVAHAHWHGVVHRDLKPANIVVDGRGRPRVLDFGVARLAAGDGFDTLHTSADQLLGTLPYMSPEQVSGRDAQVDARSDVYALGVVLYELLTGRLPLRVGGKALAAAAVTIRTVEPTPLRSLDPALRGDLDTIVAKALEKEAERRYATAAALADDVRRFLAGTPISARAPSAAYHLARFAKRHRGVALMVAVTFVVLVAGVVTTTVMYLRARHMEQAARQQAAAALANLLQGEKCIGSIVDTCAQTLTGLTGSTAARATIMRSAHAELQRMIALHPDADRPHMGYLYQRLGRAELDMGRPLVALASLEQAQRYRAAALATDPGSADLLREMGVGLWQLAQAHGLHGDHAAALREDERALEVIERACQLHPTKAILLPYRAYARYRLAERLMAVGQNDRASAVLVDGLADCDRITAEPAFALDAGGRDAASVKFDPLFVHGTRPLLLRVRAQLRLHGGEHEAALGDLQQGALVLQGLMPPAGSHSHWQRLQLAVGDIWRARTLAAMGRHDHALLAAQAAVAPLAAIVAADADAAAAIVLYGDALAELSRCELQVGDDAGSLRDAQRARTAVEHQANANPDHGLMVLALGLARLRLALAQRALAARRAPATVEPGERDRAFAESAGTLASAIAILEELERDQRLRARDRALLAEARKERAEWERQGR